MKNRVSSEFHKVSDKHILILETDMPIYNIRKIVKDIDKVRRAGNVLVSKLKKNYEQLMRTKQYRGLLKAYGKASKKDKKGIGKQLEEMQKKYNVTFDFCRISMQEIGKHFGIGSIFALTKAEDIWRGMEKILYSEGRSLHYTKCDDLSILRAKQINRGIVLRLNKTKDNLVCSYEGINFGFKIKDRFQQEEINAIIWYLNNSDVIDTEATNLYKQEGIIVSTYRPIYVTLKVQQIRGKYRLYAHITIEGTPFNKYNKMGTLRNNKGNGILGIDIGTQTIAYTSELEIGLKNLVERGSSIKNNERKERKLYRALDRSRRATNLNNYNEDGTIKCGKKVWKYSNRYKKLKARHKDLCRKNAINRKLAIQEEVNHLRSIANIVITEPKNASKLAKKAKLAQDDKGGYKRRKRFGKSIKNRCSGYLQEQLRKKFSTYIEVPYSYRASQYDHTVDDYIKKDLSDRIYKLSNGVEVQRDLYSSFLLYCCNMGTLEIDKQRCNIEFSNFKEKEENLIKYIKENSIKIKNSGIKTA